MGDDICGYPTDGGDGPPCELPASKADDRCHHHTDTDERANGGRERALDESDHEDILEAAEKGVSKAGCARAAGVGEATLARYLSDNDDFRSDFARARARGEQRLATGPLMNDDETPDMDGQHARFLLSTSFDYQKTERKEVEHAGEGGGPMEYTVNYEVVGDGDE